MTNFVNRKLLADLSSETAKFYNLILIDSIDAYINVNSMNIKYVSSKNFHVAFPFSISFSMLF